MTDINKLMAEALVECGYAAETYESDSLGLVIQHEKGGRSARTVNPFADTLEGRRQADALEDWIGKARPVLWIESEKHGGFKASSHQWRLDRIKWCFEQLAEKDDEQP